MADNVFAFRGKVKTNRYVMHDDNPDVVKANSPDMDPHKHGFVPIHTHRNGVKEHADPEFGSHLFEAHAPNIKEARKKIHEASETASDRDSAAFDRMTGNPAQSKEIFRRDKAQIMPFKKPE